MTEEDWKWVDEVLIPFIKALKAVPKSDRKYLVPLALRLLR